MQHVITDARTGQTAFVAFTAEEIAAAAPTRQKLKDYAAAARYAIETRGITVAGASIMTDRQSQALITGANALAAADPAAPIDFKGASGWVTIDAATMAAIALAVGQHVRASFTAEKQVAAAIDAGTVTDFAGVDALFATLI
jgi:hypothetical protein